MRNPPIPAKRSMNVNFGFSEGKKGTVKKSENKEYCKLSSATQSVPVETVFMLYILSNRISAFCLNGSANLYP